jgi:hypothetical protein
VIDDLLGGPRMSFTCPLKATEFDSIVIDWKVQSSLDMAYCALQQHNFKLALSKLAQTRPRLDQCRASRMQTIYWHEIYCDVHLKRRPTSLSTLLSTSIAKELKKIDGQLESVDIDDQQRATLFRSRSIQLHSQFSRMAIDFLLDQPQAYVNYEHDQSISSTKHKQFEIYLDHPTKDLQQTTNLIEELFYGNIRQLNDNIARQQVHSQHQTVSLSEYYRMTCFNSCILHGTRLT